jgi:hypothetical protein
MAAIRREPSSSTSKWVPPPAGILLVNVDAATFATTRQIGVGVVVPDHSGTFRAACGERHNEVISPELAEALALCHAVSFAIDGGYSRVIFASDCQSVINRGKSTRVDRSSYGPVIEVVKLLAKLNLLSSVFSNMFIVRSMLLHTF